jgi:hypothetical protein
MMAGSKRWIVQDRYGNKMYLTQERWEHIIDPLNHPEMLDYEKHLKESICSGVRKQDSINPQKYRYMKAFDDLVEDNTHIVAIVLFRFRTEHDDMIIPNNYIVTAYQKEIG